MDLSSIRIDSGRPGDWFECGDGIHIAGGQYISPEKSDSLLPLALLSQHNFEPGFEIYKNVSYNILDAYSRIQTKVKMLLLILKYGALGDYKS